MNRYLSTKSICNIFYESLIYRNILRNKASLQPEIISLPAKLTNCGDRKYNEIVS